MPDPGFDWGDELRVDPPLSRLPDSLHFYEYARFLPLLALRDAYLDLRDAQGDADWPSVLRRGVAHLVPPGVAIVAVSGDGIDVTTAAPGWLVPGQTRDIALLVANDTDEQWAASSVSSTSGEVRLVAAATSHAAPAVDVSFAVGSAVVQSATPVMGAQLIVRAASPARWSITDSSGYGWFAPGVLEKYDFHDRAFFHAEEAVVTVPVGVALTVAVACGVEYERREVTATLDGMDGPRVVELEPRRLYDAARRGSYGGDLHVHMNYSGDMVATPDDAAAMHVGEGLHPMNLVAANMHTSLIYDREALETWAGKDLPWSTPDHVARYGVE